MSQSQKATITATLKTETYMAMKLKMDKVGYVYDLGHTHTHTHLGISHSSVGYQALLDVSGKHEAFRGSGTCLASRLISLVLLICTGLQRPSKTCNNCCILIIPAAHPVPRN